jgi:hypothetical protein
LLPCSAAAISISSEYLRNIIVTRQCLDALSVGGTICCHMQARFAVISTAGSTAVAQHKECTAVDGL